MGWLGPLSWVYQQLATTHHGLYSRNILKSVHLKTRVVSIGNLSVGGTGKTPFIDFILQDLERKKIRVGVVSKSYKARIQSSARVDVNHPEAAAYFGDEPFLLALKHPDVPVYVGPEKWKTAQLLESSESVDFILLDDGFQHHRLFKNKNILLLDASQPVTDYQALPAGRLREKFKEFQRADLIVLTKMQMAQPATLDFFRQQGIFKKRTLEMDQKVSQIYSFTQPQIKNQLQALAGKKILLFCGLAVPDNFFQMVKSQISEAQYIEMRFPDHHSYSETDFSEIQKTAHAQKVDLILTTEKDAVKFQKNSSWGCREDLWICPLTVSVQKNQGWLDEIFIS